MNSLISSSSISLKWLVDIKTKVEEKNLSLKYNEAKYWASFESPKTDRNIAYLQPQKTQIRLFVRLIPAFASALQETPATHQWADMYPSIFTIKSENSIDKAVDFIVASYHEDFRIDVKKLEGIEDI